MRALVQRVSRASVTVAEGVVGAIGPGLCVLVGVTHTDTAEIARKMAEKVWNLRIFDDDDGVMNRSLSDLGAQSDSSAQALVISQFTLYGSTTRGRRPSWIDAAPGDVAEPLVEMVIEHLRSLGATIATGRFGAEMAVELVNDGPVTLMIELD